MPSSSALDSLDPAFAPTITQYVFLLTEDAAFPPLDTIASLAESRVKSSKDPVTTTVLPLSVCSRLLDCAESFPTTPASFHFLKTSLCQSLESFDFSNQS